MAWKGNLVEIGRGRVEQMDGGWRLSLPAASSQQYSDAQLDDTAGLRRAQYLWRPPLTLSLRARFSHKAEQLRGTAGFGFWNVPFGPGLARVPALPRAVWFFFGSPPHHVPLALGVPGDGWKASCLDTSRWQALAWLPLAPLAVLALQNRAVCGWLWPRIQRSLAMEEAIVPADMREWHHYTLEWRADAVEFWVEDQRLLRTAATPRGPLGLVIWIDNQYAIATPRGRFGWGLLELAESQWMELVDLRIEATTL